MGNANANKINSSYPVYRARLGIGRRQDNSASFKVMMQTKNYDAGIYLGYMKHPYDGSNNLKQVGGAEFDKDVSSRVDKVLAEVTEKTKQTRALFLQNPYLPYQLKWPFSLQPCFSSIMDRLRPYPPLWLLMPFVVVFYLVIVLLASMVGTVVDVLLCRLICRGSAKEQEWLQSAMAAHPDLDGDAIDDMAAKGMQAIVAHVQSTYPHLRVIYFMGVERIIEQGSTPDWDMEELMLMILDEAEYQKYQNQEQLHLQQSQAMVASWVQTGSVVPAAYAGSVVPVAGKTMEMV